MNSERQLQKFQRRSYTRVMDWYRSHSVRIPLWNPAARIVMRAMYRLHRQRVGRYCKDAEEGLDKWFNSLNLFFGFSSPRGGTVFLVNLLRNEMPLAHVEHEACLDDYWVMPDVIQNPEVADSYLGRYRRCEIYYRSPHDIATYGEINPFLRMHCHAFPRVFPRARLFHMIRDPREVLRSLMDRENLGPRDPMSRLIFPPPRDPYHDRWKRMTRFEKLCWAWQFENRHMRTHIEHTVQFEPMLTDYEYFKEQVADFLDFEISCPTWKRYVSRPRNVTRSKRSRHWSEWDRSMLDTLERICGEEMVRYGYSV